MSASKTDSVISLRDVSKRYVKYDDQPMLVNALRFRARSRRSTLLAVDNMNLDIAAGESVGVLGRNGAGKSTLLQLLCGVTAPSSGVVAVRGKVAPLISVGVGFHPELTGRENVYVNGTILGMSSAEIDRRLDSIIDFAEVEDFIDTPVKFYSSGMFVRLGFSVAVAADPDVLLVDEVLAVGDFAFQLKCFTRMQEIRAQGTTIVVVSHNINVIRGFCDRALVMSHGQKVFDGPTFEAISEFYSVVGREAKEDLQGAGDLAAHDAVIESLTLHNAAGGEPTLHFDSGDEVALRLRVRATTDIANPVMGMTITAETGTVVYSDTNLMNPFDPLSTDETAEYEMRLALSLPSGGYYATASFHSAEGGSSVLLGRAVPVTFYVSGRSLASGVADLGGTFHRAGS
ncbi:MAG TPA: ABC transporter ATP-binding protein [Mycobacteriales bacterium]|nr:ABC transporter ATP-binding protein [Mycobacteriales bacterium]HWC34251.1 ABC transporter ATP-binding protein [Mycobacteriales bacterium]